VTFAFRDHVLDVERCEPRPDGDLVPFENHVFGLFVLLVRNRVRSKGDLIGAIRGGQVVFQSAVTTQPNVA
jgi:DNA-binding winged helix-turn-helix (wHTH) protein